MGGWADGWMGGWVGLRNGRMGGFKEWADGRMGGWDGFKEWAEEWVSELVSLI